MLTVFGASLVESVEALTIVLASGASRGWRSAIEGTLSALALLALVAGIAGVSLGRYVPLQSLREVVGSLLLVMGLSWMRKAILRGSGNKAIHDEDLIYEETLRALGGRSARSGTRDNIGFMTAFKGVLLEGIEVILIVISFGASQHRLGLAALAAVIAVVLVVVCGIVVARQLSSVPENLIKSLVGVMLSSFGIFWIGEGAGVAWPGKDLSIVVLAICFTGIVLVGSRLLRTPARAPLPIAPTIDLANK